MIIQDTLYRGLRIGLSMNHHLVRIKLVRLRSKYRGSNGQKHCLVIAPILLYNCLSNKESSMILYNPFKPHIVEFEDGMFGIRKLTLKGYNFLDLTLKLEYLEYWYSKAGFLCKTHNKEIISKKMAGLIMNKPTFKVKRVLDYDC